MAENLKEKADEVVQTLKDYYNDEAGWTLTKKNELDKDLCTISYKSSKDFEGNIYKGEAIINAPPATVFQYVDPLPDSPRGKWDSNMKKIEVVENIDETHRVNRACTASACMGLISPRDFVDVIVTKETDECISTNAVSVPHSGCPEDKKYVRGHNYPCGLICFKLPNEPNKTKLVSLIQPDIKGLVPHSLVDQAIPSSMTEFFTELTDALKKDGKMVN